MSPRLCTRAGPALLLLAILLVFFHRVVFVGEVFSPADLLFSHSPWSDHYGARPASNHSRSDEVFLYHPAMASHWARLKHGEFPGLDASQLAGSPAFFQGLFLGLTVYPVSLVYYLFPALDAEGLFAILRLYLAGLFMFAYCRRTGLNRVAAALGGVAYMLNGHFVVWLSSPIPTVALWLPLGLLALEHLLASPCARSAVLFGVALAPMYLGGYMPTAIVASLLLGAYGLAGSALRGRQGLRAIGWAALAALLGLAIGAIGLLPGISMLRGGDLVQRVAGLQAYPIQNLATFVFADFWGTHLDNSWRLAGSNYCEMVTYLGLAPLVLAPLAFVLRRTWRTWFFGAVAVSTVGYVYGGPGLRLAGHLPMLQAINGYRWVLALAVATSVLSAITLDGLMRREARRQAVVAGTALAVSVAILAAYAVLSRAAWPGTPATYQARIVGGGLRAAAYLATILALICWLLSRFAKPAAAGIVMVGVVAVDLVNAGVWFNPTLPAAMCYPTTPGITWLQQHAGDTRIAFLGDPPVGLMPGVVPGLYGLRSLGGYDFKGDRRYQGYLASTHIEARAPSAAAGYVYLPRDVNPSSPILDLLNARFLASPSDLDVLNSQPVAVVSQADGTVREIIDGRVVGQTFFCPVPGLSRIDFYPATYARVIRGRLVFHLAEEAGSAERVTREFALESVIDNAQLKIAFPPLGDSAGKRYRFWVESPGARPGEAITLWANERDAYRDGTRLEGGRPTQGDLRFSAYATPPLAPPDLRQVYRGDLNVFENLDVLPYAWVVHDSEVAGEGAILPKLLSGFPVRTRALVERPLSSAMTAGAGAEGERGSPDQIRWTRPRPEHVEVALSLAVPGLLVISERFDERWHATVDGRGTAPVRVDGLLMGLEVPAGKHRVVLDYWDPLVSKSAVISGAGVMLALGLLFLRRGRSDGFKPPERTQSPLP